MTLLEELKNRGFVKDCTNFEKLDELMNEKQQTFYVGTDLTADSLHVGHLMPLMFMRKLLYAGHRVIIILGGGTTRIGDPSFKNEMRKMLTEEQIATNKAGILQCVSQVFNRDLTQQKEGEFVDNLMIIDNATWLLDINYIKFLKEVGIHFTINNMINMDFVKQRLDNNLPLTFFEFNYMLIQGYDFYYLYKNFGCNVQIGGSDQWGNILQGCRLIRKKSIESRQVVNEDDVDVFGITMPLLTKSDGTKMGKSVNGAVWLRSDKLSSYDYFQYFRDCADDDTIKFLKIFTDIYLDKIDEYSKLKYEELNSIKEILAFEATKICRGEIEAKKATNREIADEVFVQDGQNIIETLVKNGLCKSNGEARRLLDQNGVKIDDNTINKDFVFQLKDKNEYKELSLGKKRKFIIKVK